MAGQKRIVVFGPFVGEFGWELLFWHGVVKRLCNEEFRDWHKIAISRIGREPFYPYVDEFVALPRELTAGMSARGYFTDGWRDGHPGSYGYPRYLDFRNLKRILRGKCPEKIPRFIPWPGPSVEPQVERFMEDFISQFKLKPRLVSPLQINSIGELEFGIDLGGKTKTLDDRRAAIPPLEKQKLEYLSPLKPESVSWAEQFATNQRLLAVFPRRRGFRRPDKNWSENNYRELIRAAIRDGYKVLIFGEPAGAYFSGESIEGCANLVNLPEHSRFDCQLAALRYVNCAVGSVSGALLVALAAGVPAVIFGDATYEARYRLENFMKSPLTYVGSSNPNPDELWASTLNFVRSLGGG